MTFENIRIETINRFKLFDKIAERLNKIEDEYKSVEVIETKINDNTAEILIEVEQ